MNGFDVIVLTVILLSGLLAFSRGLVKEALSLAAWAGAGFAALYGAPLFFPAVARFLPKSAASAAASQVVAAVVVFLAALIVLSMVTSAIARRVRQSSLSALDRTLGLIFGLLRGAVLVSLAYVALAWALPAETSRPQWIAEARTLPFLAAGADRLRELVPAAYRAKAGIAAGRARSTAEQVNEAATAIGALSTPRLPGTAAPDHGAGGYTADDEHELDRLIRQQQGQHD